MNLIPKNVLVAAVAFLAAIAFAGPAQAVSWASSSSPLIAYEDSVGQAKAYGNFYNNQNVYAKNSSHQYDMKPGGNGVFVNTTFKFIGGGQVWHKDEHSTSATTSASWIQDSTSEPLQGCCDRAEGHSKVCERQNNSFDPCSIQAFPSFSY